MAIIRSISEKLYFDSDIEALGDQVVDLSPHGSGKGSKEIPASWDLFEYYMTTAFVIAKKLKKNRALLNDIKANYDEVVEYLEAWNYRAERDAVDMLLKPKNVLEYAETAMKHCLQSL